MKKKGSGLKGVVLKVASRCNLNCAYCYMYHAGDESYRLQPKVMEPATVESVIGRVRDHCREFGLTEFEFIFHGGEPLLAGPAFFRRFVRRARHQIGARVRLRFGLQTNGVLLNEAWLTVLKELEVGIGVSLDGPQAWNDHYRKDRLGRGTHDAVVRNIQAARVSGSEPGVLSVLNIEADPVALYDYFWSLRIRRLDFLWPNHHYDVPALAYQRKAPSSAYTPYGDWWIRLFDRWFNDPGPKPGIRFLHQVILVILGIDKGFETIGRQENRYLVIETDGSMEASDYLKACGNGFTKEGMNVVAHCLSEAGDTPLIHLHRHSHRQLCEQCRNCAVSSVCGGGHLAHRYSRERGFDNPSLYCYDLMKLITHVQNALIRSLPPELTEQAGLALVTYAQALAALDRKPARNSG